MINNREKVRQDGQRLIDEQEHGQFKETKEFHMKKNASRAEWSRDYFKEKWESETMESFLFCFVLNRFYF